MVIALSIAGAVNLSMMIVAAALFHGSGLTGVDSIEGAFDGFKTLVSDRAATIFGIALLASGFASSSVGTMAGQVVMQGFIRRRIPLFLRRAITLAPALVVLAIGINPTDALVVSQVVLSFGIPFALVPLLMIARDREVMGSLVNPALADRDRGRPRRADHRPQRLPAPAGLLRLNALGYASRMSLAEDFQRDARRAAARLDGPRGRPADRRRERATSTPRSRSARSTRSPTRAPTGTGGCWSPTASATPPRRRR